MSSSVFVSCSSDDNVTKEVEVTKEQQLLAKWTAREIDLNLQLGDNIIADEIGTDITNELELYFEFEENNVVNLYQKQFYNGAIIDVTGTYKITDSEISVNFSGQPQIFVYELNDDKLSLTINTEEMYEGEVLKMKMTYHLYK